MANSSRNEAALIGAWLEEEPGRWDFFQAVRAFERAFGRRAIGRSLSPQDDPIRFRQVPTLAFTGSSIAKFEASAPARLWVNFFGLLGVNGPMPLWLTEEVIEREAHRDRALSAFLDIFHHRMVSLFYRAWACHQKAVDLEIEDAARFPDFFGSLIGLGMKSLRNRDSVPYFARIYYSGRLASLTRAADGLEAILEDYFEVPSRVTPFIGQWIELPRESVCRLGRSRETGTLGENVILGGRVWDRQRRFEVHLGPMSLEDYLRFLPTGTGHNLLSDWIRSFAGAELEWSLRLGLRGEEVPAIQLGRFGQLGWNTWMKGTASTQDRHDLLLDGMK